MIKVHSFGSLEPLLTVKDRVICELATFTGNGKSHKHDQWEICYVQAGEGLIKYQSHPSAPAQTLRKVKAGDTVKIPAGLLHWMEVDDGMTMVILIVYALNP